ncbi:hypothetical protein F5890DRAFT_1375655, partial [Lentinula detonsa]
MVVTVNDLPAARKIAGFPGVTSGFICTCCGLHGKTSVFNTDHSQWIPRNKNELCRWAKPYRDAQTLDEQRKVLEKYGVCRSLLWLLDYWDPMWMLVIDDMHYILEGV